MPISRPSSSGFAPSCEEAIVSPATRPIHDLVERAAQTDVTVLILGETGTGKEILAAKLHRLSTRASGPMHVINCAAIPETLIESVLFGHERGAFTGAISANKGTFERAHGGTLFLDEVAELSAGAQAALLRVLETGYIQRLGSSKPIAVNVRVVSATHADLPNMVEQGRFRRDLFYRLNAFSLHVPPLRERLEEIPPLVRLFIQQAHERWKPRAMDMAPEALDVLMKHTWPGNARELRNVIEHALVVASGPTVRLEDLPESVRSGATQRVPSSKASSDQAALRRSVRAEQTGETRSFRERMRQQEAAVIADALREADGNRRKAAEALGLPLRTFARKAKLLGLT